MKTISLIAALALPLAACGSTPKAPEQASVPSDNNGRVNARTDMSDMDPMARLDMSESCDASQLGVFDVFGLETSAMAASSPETMPAVAGALAQQNRESLVQMCSQDMPSAYVLQRGTWMEVVGAGTECVVYGNQVMDVEMVTCEVVASPAQQMIGQRVTMPIGWLQGRIARDAR